MSKGKRERKKATSETKSSMDNMQIYKTNDDTYLLASSSLLLASISLLGGYCGRLEGSQAKGSVLKNCKTENINGMNANYILTIND